MVQQTFMSLFTSSFSFSSTSQTLLQSILDNQLYSDILSQYTIHDRTQLLDLSDPSVLTWAWLQVLPSLQLELVIYPAELIVALCLLLRIPVFLEADSSSCSLLIGSGSPYWLQPWTLVHWTS